MDPIQSVRGFRDLLPPGSERASALELSARERLGLYGFRELRLPTLELRDLFVKSTGETTDIVEKEMFVLEDSGGRRMALRPEGTPGAVRAFLNHRLAQGGPAVKLFYLGSMFRAERPQAGRYREFEQIGAETFGNPHPASDVESILALKSIFEAAGLGGRLRLRLNNLGCDEDPSCRPRYRSALRAFLAEREAQLCPNCRSRIARNPLRALDCKLDGPLLAGAAPRLEPCPACASHVGEVSLRLRENGAPHEYPDPLLVRGLDYYNRTVFEFSCEGIGSQDAIAGGGRYDSLVAAMGGAGTPAVGWALGVERTLLAVEAFDPEFKALGSRLPPGGPRAFVVLQSREGAGAGMRLIESLRRAGIRAEGGLFASSLKAQMREANRCGAAFCAILGEEELKSEPPCCTLKSMADGTQRKVELGRLAEALS